jgi:hypothetical protein
MDIEAFIKTKPEDRHDTLLKIHQTILEQDKTVTAVVEPMMGKEMIIYKGKGVMKYGLSSVKKHMSLHVLPIYGIKTLHEKYQALLPDAAFQKGCINFKNESEMPLDVIQALITDCVPFDLARLKEEYLKSKKST